MRCANAGTATLSKGGNLSLDGLTLEGLMSATPDVPLASDVRLVVGTGVGSDSAGARVPRGGCATGHHRTDRTPSGPLLAAHRCDPYGMPGPIDETVIGRPRGPLGEVVDEHHAYRQCGLAPARHIGLPSAYLTLIVTLDEPLTIAKHVDPAQAAGDYDAMIGGLHAAPALITHNGAQSGIQLRLSPLGSRALFGMPAGEIASLDLDLRDLLGPLARELHERIRAAADWRTRFAVLDRALGARLNLDRRPPAEVCRAWQRLLTSHGTVSIRAIAEEVGWSERHLANRFRTEIGLTPKSAARVIRFQRARRLVGKRTGADVAAECGYFDQAHLVRDFVAFSGLSPTAWLAAEQSAPQIANFQAEANKTGKSLAS